MMMMMMMMMESGWKISLTDLFGKEDI